MTSIYSHSLVVVERALSLPRESEVYKSALPMGFPYLVRSPEGKVIEPVLIFLCDHFLTGSTRWNDNTVEAAAYDLRDWWLYLSFRQLSWHEAEEIDVDLYRSSMSDTVSPRTHQPYARKTIERRVGLVTNFYDYCRKREWYSGSICRVATTAVRRSIDRDSLAYLGGRATRSTRPVGLPGVGQKGATERIRPLSSADWLLLARKLGPLPLERRSDLCYSRNRLTAELALLTGMRVSEVASLRYHEIIDICRRQDSIEGVTALRITKTKGLRPRNIFIPNFLIPELAAYASGERRLAADALIRSQKMIAEEASAAFFINGLNSSWAGTGISTETISDSFRVAAIAAGLTRKILATNPESSQQYVRTVAKHCFHDLRHTFAVWLYEAEKEVGNPEPWKVVQARLGHRSLQTTLDTYLNVVSAERAAIGRKYYNTIRRISSVE